MENRNQERVGQGAPAFDCCRHWLDKATSPFWAKIMLESGEHRYHKIRFCPECGRRIVE